MLKCKQVPGEPHTSPHLVIATQLHLLPQSLAILAPTDRRATPPPLPLLVREREYGGQVLQLGLLGRETPGVLGQLDGLLVVRVLVSRLGQTVGLNSVDQPGHASLASLPVVGQPPLAGWQVEVLEAAGLVSDLV